MRWHLTPAAIAPAATLVALCFGPLSAASAQRVPPDGFSVQRFTPAEGTGNYVMVDGANVGTHHALTLGAVVDYSHRPFVLHSSNCDADGRCAGGRDVDLVTEQVTFNLMASYALWQRLELGLLVPFVGSSGDSFSTPQPNLPEEYLAIRGGQAFGLGDPRLRAKLRLTRPGAPLSLAAIAYATAPLGEATARRHWLGDPGVTAGGHLALDFGGRVVRFALNAGAHYRPFRKILTIRVGPELTFGGAVSVAITPLLRVMGEVTGATRTAALFDETPLEVRGAAELNTGDFALMLGAGTGLISGVGVPDLRPLLGIAYRPQGLDSDGDGVPDKRDACPSEAEDKDGYQDDDGCPDLDNDGDGILDAADRCPNQPEDKDGFQDDDGCPDEDDDGDGIPDGYDSCPRQPEDKDGDRDDDGCPDDDRDRDGIPDAADKCPNDPEDIDGFGDEDGCPEVDFDQDGIPDDEDQCPDQPEDKDGYQDDDGCPEENPPPAPAATHAQPKRRASSHAVRKHPR